MGKQITPEASLVIRDRILFGTGGVSGCGGGGGRALCPFLRIDGSRALQTAEVSLAVRTEMSDSVNRLLSAWPPVSCS